jgi:uncharacterized protein
MLTTNYVPGAPVWIDLSSPDVDAAAAFYTALFDWELQAGGPETGSYGKFTIDGATVAAIGPLTEPGANSAWTLYFDTVDAEATVKAAEQAGGSVRFASLSDDYPGPMAGLTDPAGAQFTVWQHGDRQGLGAVTVPNTLCWTELYTTDPAAAKAFYHSVLDWVTEGSPMGDFTYTVIRPAGGGRESGQGGIMGINNETASAGLTPRWQPYFEVTDCDAVAAKATERGGTVPMPPESVESVGRLAQLVDPFGAPFAIITSVPA